MKNTANTQLALIQHGYGILAIVDTNSIADLTVAAAANGVETFEYELGYDRPYTYQEIENLPRQSSDRYGLIYVESDATVIAQY